jgi:ABC-type transport system involved in multi-copper enzyme maturation permease subunit
MTWLTWRQHRGEAFVVAAIFVLVTPILIVSGIGLEGAYQRLGAAACVGHANLPNCEAIYRALDAPYALISNALPWPVNLFPALLAMFVGAPLIAREFEHGTFRSVWTQSVTRLRWLATKLGLVLGGCVLASLALSLLLTWWYTPYTELLGKFNPAFFNLEGLAPIARMIFAFALAVSLGAAVRRTIPAMALTLFIYTACGLTIQVLLRPSYLLPITLTGPDAYLTRNQDDWVLDSGVRTTTHHTVDPLQVSQACGSAGPEAASCIHAHGWTEFLTYQPADRYWLFQGIEVGIFLLLAAALVTLTFWIVRRRLV